MKRRNWSIAFSILLLLLLTGFVYAAFQGLLTFTGTSRFNNVTLNIVNEAVVDPELGDSAVVTGGNTLTFSLLMTKPTETRYVNFKIHNSGNLDAVLGALDVTDPEEGSGLLVVWPNLSGVTIASGATSSLYTIEVTWDPEYPDVSENADFSATITYAQATPPPG